MSSSWDGRSACKVFQPPYNVASFGFLVDQPDSKGSLHATPHPIQQNQMLSYEQGRLYVIARCEGHHQSPPDHPSPHRLRLLTAAAAAAAARSRHAPFARPVLLSDLPSTMDKFVIRKPKDSSSSSSSSKRICVDLNNLPSDPGLREPISSYHPNDQDNIRRAYIQKGPCQIVPANLPQTKIGGSMRRFNPDWQDVGKQAGGDTFVRTGFKLWHKKEKLQTHVGGVNSAHHQARKKCEDLMKPNQHINNVFVKQTKEEKIKYRIQLNATVDCIRFLLRQGLAFRGHDESSDSSDKGNFLELLQFLADHNESINEVIQNCPKNNKLTHPNIQKDIVNAAACETTNAIIKDLDNGFFSVLVDESRDTSIKEQMAVVLRYVDKKGNVTERFLGIVHVTDTTALSLKVAIESLFSKHGLSLSRLRGQGYDGASNMQAVAKNHNVIAEFFCLVAKLINIVGGSCKRRDALRDAQFVEIEKALDMGELQSGQGLNQETNLKRAGDTHWGSHYGTIINLILMFSAAVEVLEIILEDGTSYEQKGDARSTLKLIISFEFAFALHLMKSILGVTNELSIALQKKNQNIVNAITLVNMSKKRLQMMRDNGWESLLAEVLLFCDKHDIPILNMDEIFVVGGRLRRQTPQITNLHHFRVELFYTVIDMQLQELNNRFSEANTELLLCMACLNPSNSFCAFDKQKLIRLAELYPYDFSKSDLMALDIQLQNYIVDLQSNDMFIELNGIDELARKMVETEKDVTYPLVYLLVKLVLTLPVATATVERSFSAMKYIKNQLRNRMGDQWMNDCLVTYIESDVFDSIDNEAIMQRYQAMKTRRRIL
uniref:TTF-type domain-containing protein n=1 Tax=Fagus sylvatica TaxID=28930 RepID=A0A2N9GI12_FAGSY